MPCDRAPKLSILREPPLCNQAGAAPTRRNGLACFGPTGVQEQGAETRGSLGNLRDLVISIVTAGQESRHPKDSRWIRSSRPELAGTKRGRNDGIAKRRQRSAAKRMARSRSVP
jgi:hypothetical protein